MEILKRILELNAGIIDGDKMRRVISLFPHLENSFRKIESYDEYFYDGGFIELSIDNINKLTDSGFKVVISTDTISIWVKPGFVTIVKYNLKKWKKLKI